MARGRSVRFECELLLFLAFPRGITAGIDNNPYHAEIILPEEHADSWENAEVHLLNS